MNLIYDTLVFNKQKHGGISTVFNEIFSRHLENKQKITLITSKMPIINADFLQLNIPKENFYPCEKFNHYQLLNNTNPFLPKKLIQNQTIFHSTLYRTAKNKNVKSVVTINDFTYQKYFTGIPLLLNNHQKNNCARNASGIICISENTKKDFLHYFPDFNPSFVKVIYLAANEVFSSQEESKLPNKFAFLEGKKYVLFVGARTFYKKFDFAIRSIETQPDSYLVVVGGGDFSDKERKDIEGIKDRCVFLSGVTIPDLHLLYKNAFCLLYPSEYEGFGIPVLEAMSSGCPVIAMNKSSIPEVSRGSCLLLDEYSIEKINECFLNLSRFSFRNEIIQKEIQASSFFSWDKTYQEFMDFYDYILRF